MVEASCPALASVEKDEPQQSENDSVEEIAQKHINDLLDTPEDIAPLRCWVDGAMPNTLEVSIREKLAGKLDPGCRKTSNCQIRNVSQCRPTFAEFFIKESGCSPWMSRQQKFTRSQRGG